MKENKAKESQKISKAREKLKKNLAVEHQLFTSQALKDIAKKIRRSLTRHHPEVSNLEDHKITLYGNHKAPIKDKQILKLQKLLRLKRIEFIDKD